MKLKRCNREVPELQMVAMPDLIFTVLFFFMIVTNMREDTLKLAYSEPQGVNLQKIDNSAAVIDVYIGKSPSGKFQIQVNNTLVPISELVNVLVNESAKMSTERRASLCASLQADVNTPMHIINKLKIALREAGISKINYSGINFPAKPNSQKYNSN